MPIHALATLSGETPAETVQHLSDIVTADMMSGVLSEIIGMLPVVIPVTIGFIAVRKGLAFLFSSLRKA